MYSFNYLSTYLISYLLFVHQVCLVHFCWWVLVNFLNLHCKKSGQSWPCPLLLVGLSYFFSHFPLQQFWMVDIVIFFSLPVATMLDERFWQTGGSPKHVWGHIWEFCPSQIWPSSEAHSLYTGGPARPLTIDGVFIRIQCLRPYHVESTSSRPITEVKQRWVVLVLGWVTAWEYTML